MDIEPLNPTNISKNNYAKTPGQFKWNSSSKEKISSYLRSHDFTKAVTILKQNLESSTSDMRMNTAVIDIINILINVSKNSLKLSKTQEKKEK